MTHKDHRLNLVELVDQLGEAAQHLQASYDRCMQLAPERVESEDGLVEFEALTGRFARAADMLIHKVYRSIDAVEFVEGGTLIDAINRADKRKLIDSVEEMRLMKDLRNDIAHEYLTQRLKLPHEEVVQYTPKLLELIQRARTYTDQYRL